VVLQANFWLRCALAQEEDIVLQSLTKLKQQNDRK
jgi:hypothetical protein